MAGKTVCVVGAGGIGQEVGRLCAALGMHVVGTRSSAGAAVPDGFDHVGGPLRRIVGAGPQARDAVFERVTRRQHKHGDRLPLGAPAREHRHAVFVWQAEVEHTDIKVRRAYRCTRLRGGVDVVHGHAEQTQPGDDATGNETVVFNQQDVHSSFRRGH